MATFLVVHGAWTGGWFWRKMRTPLRGCGHEIWTPTLTGVGERSHLAHRDICLETHITDVMQILTCENLWDVTLIGHSYGGMVMTGVANRMPERLTNLVYLDAFVPQNDESLLDLLPNDTRIRMLEATRLHGDGWRVPPNPMPPDTSESDRDWAVARRVPQPLQTFQQPLQLQGALDALPKHYIYCTRFAPGDVFQQFATRARSAAGWTYSEIDASHNPHVTATEALVALLDGLSHSAQA